MSPGQGGFAERTAGFSTVSAESSRAGPGFQLRELPQRAANIRRRGLLCLHTMPHRLDLALLAREATVRVALRGHPNAGAATEGRPYS